MPNHYNKAIIYIILDKRTRECFVGSTATDLAKRMYRHRKDYECYTNWVAGGQQDTGAPRHCVSFKLLKQNQYISYELEKFPCTTKKELVAREQYYVEKYKNEIGELCLNTQKRKGIDPRCKQACTICGKVGLLKNMTKHQQSSRCKESNSPPPTDEQLALVLKAKKAKLSETQNAKVACAICGFLTSKRNMKRHQDGANCKPSLA